MKPVDQFDQRLAPLIDEVCAHPVYDWLDTLPALRSFMEHHVFAVWDFMSLLTSLQRQLTCTTVPWMPPIWPPAVVRFVNELVLGEASDPDPNGGWCSHFDLYRRAMDEVGASRTTIDRFTHAVRTGVHPYDACPVARVPAGAGQFLGRTMQLIEQGSLAEQVGAFTAGREQLIPQMFTRLLAREGVEAPQLAYYLERHVEVDGEEHGPLTRRLLVAVCGHDPRAWWQAEQAARRALRARQALWDAVMVTPVEQPVA